MYTLMIKVHNITGLKYLCKCSHGSYESYPGSGTYWKRHIRKHGKDISTEIIFQSEDFDEFKRVSTETSINLNVVDSDEWANLIHETGSDGGLTHNNPFWLNGYNHTEEAKRKIGEASKRMWENGGGTSSFKGKTHSEETKSKMSISSKGKPKSPQHREALKSALLKRIHIEWSDDRKKQAALNMASMTHVIYECGICGKRGNAGQIARYHANCQLDPEFKLHETLERSSDIITLECVICKNTFMKKRKSKKCTCSGSCATNLYWRNKK